MSHGTRRETFNERHFYELYLSKVRVKIQSECRNECNIVLIRNSELSHKKP